MAILLFEPETSKLSEYELSELVPVMVKCLQNKVGKDNAVSNSFMVEKMQEHGYKISEARVRKIINHIRSNGIIECLIASNRGYYITKDKNEMKNYCHSLFQRQEAIEEVRIAMENQLDKMK